MDFWLLCRFKVDVSRARPFFIVALLRNNAIMAA